MQKPAPTPAKVPVHTILLIIHLKSTASTRTPQISSSGDRKSQGQLTSQTNQVTHLFAEIKI